jgi:hypothetical protein
MQSRLQIFPATNWHSCQLATGPKQAGRSLSVCNLVLIQK